MNELKQGTEIGDYVVLYSMTNKEYTQTYCVADKNNFQFFMKVYDMRHTPDFLCNGKDPQELWAYSRLGLCDYLPRLQHSGRTTVNRTEIVYLVTKYFRGKLLSQYIEENGPMTQGEAQSVALSLVKAVTGQTLIRLKNVQPNKNYLTKKQYPFFAQYDVVMTRL